jgi:hypothetical protein
VKQLRQLLKTYNLQETQKAQCPPEITQAMERAGTGVALFRNIYRDFLKESFELVKIDKLEQGYVNFIEIANLWTRVSSAFEKSLTNSKG